MVAFTSGDSCEQLACSSFGGGLSGEDFTYSVLPLNPLRGPLLGTIPSRRFASRFSS